VIFQDFTGPGIFKKKIQDFPAGVGTLCKCQSSATVDVTKVQSGTENVEASNSLVNHSDRDHWWISHTSYSM